MMDKEKGTAPVSSVGADAKQPPIKSHTKSIADLPEQGNLQATNNESLHAISMTELYDTAYPPKAANNRWTSLQWNLSVCWCT